MEPEAQVAWDVAYWGFDPNAEADEDGVVMVESNGGYTDNQGCLGAGLRSVQPADPATEEQLRFHQGLIAELETTLEEDPRILEAQAGIRDCVRTAGYRLDEDEHLVDLVAEEVARTTGFDVIELDPLLLDAWRGEVATG